MGVEQLVGGAEKYADHVALEGSRGLLASAVGAHSAACLSRGNRQNNSLFPLAVYITSVFILALINI